MADEESQPQDRLMESEEGRNSRALNGSARSPRQRSRSENESAQTDDVNIALVPPVIICDDATVTACCHAPRLQYQLSDEDVTRFG